MITFKDLNDKLPQIAARTIIDDPSGCWVWQGARNNMGYGQKQFDGKVQYVHRIVYSVLVRPLSGGEVIDHLVCSNPICCNPNHLNPCSQRENVIRSNSPTAKNSRKTHCPNGHPYSGDNLIVHLGKWRMCKACQYSASKERRANPEYRSKILAKARAAREQKMQNPEYREAERKRSLEKYYRSKAKNAPKKQDR